MITLSIESIVSNVWYYLCKGIASICDFIISFFPDNKMENLSVPEEVANILGYVNDYFRLVAVSYSIDDLQAFSRLL